MCRASCAIVYAVRLRGFGSTPAWPARTQDGKISLSRLHRFNQRHPWSHNDHYGPWVASEVAASGARDVLDVGCGTGNLAALLRHQIAAVTGLEPAPRTARVAAERFAGDSAVTIGLRCEGALSWQRSQGRGQGAVVGEGGQHGDLVLAEADGVSMVCSATGSVMPGT
ncbi:class I SAM-dependent methyltransferase [Streptomyces rectiverticillatus]|uniref:class I SAM-dependent methyltransferase n=1 Tax=Streptomyces rectiverticillatus TaxID=173860 RepID=UPI001FED1F2F|nr:class I SAM-dependent methyltransferase [Streptomyces rectiverticillatus]